MFKFKEKILEIDDRGYSFKDNVKSSDSDADSHVGLSDEESKEQNELNVPFDFDGSEESDEQEDLEEESWSDCEDSQTWAVQNEQDTADTTTPSTTVGFKEVIPNVVWNPNFPKLLSRKARTLKRKAKEMKHKVIFKQISWMKVKHKLKRYWKHFIFIEFKQCLSN